MTLTFPFSIENFAAKRPTLMRLLVALGVAVLLSYLLRPFIFHTDDAYITYQFSYHLAAGSGYVYHPQFLPLQGSSSPLHVMTLALLGFLIPIPIDELGFFLGALGTGFLTFALMEIVFMSSETARSRRMQCLIAIAPLTFFTASTLSFGLEAVWAATLLLVLGLAVTKHRPGWVAILACLVVLTRPDWAFFLAPLAIAALLFHGWRSVGWWIPASVVMVGYFIVSRLYFGEALPYTWIAKSHMPATVSGVVSWLSFLWHYWGAAVSLLVYGLTVTYALSRWRTLPAPTQKIFIVFLLLFGFSVVYTMILKLKGAPNMPWYFVSAMAMAAAVAMIALSTLPRDLLVIAVPLIVVSHALAFISIAQEFSSPVDKTGHADRREVIGKWLANTDPDIRSRSVVAFEVGKVAFYTQARIYDILGLVSREGVEGMKRRDPGLIVRTIQPDYVVGCDCPKYMPMQFIDDPWFMEKYNIVYSWADYRVWKRNVRTPSVALGNNRPTRARVLSRAPS